jgi:hypothetical protein
MQVSAVPDPPKIQNRNEAVSPINKLGPRGRVARTRIQPTLRTDRALVKPSVIQDPERRRELSQSVPKTRTRIKSNSANLRSKAKRSEAE